MHDDDLINKLAVGDDNVGRVAVHAWCLYNLWCMSMVLMTALIAGDSDGAECERNDGSG